MPIADTDRVGDICATHRDRPDALIEILHDVQSEMGCVSDASARIIAASLNLSRAEIQGVRSFYADFTTQVRPHHRVRLCRAEACQSVGCEALATELDQRQVPHEAVYCLGNCSLGPAALIGDRLLGRATAETVIATLADTADHV